MGSSQLRGAVLTEVELDALSGMVFAGHFFSNFFVFEQIDHAEFNFYQIPPVLTFRLFKTKKKSSKIFNFMCGPKLKNIFLKITWTDWSQEKIQANPGTKNVCQRIIMFSKQSSITA
jgi:hypothetical protein